MIAQPLNEHVSNIEKLGTLSKEILQFIYEQKLFKLFLPTQLGGCNMTFPEGVRIFQQMSEIDGNLGWLVTIGTGGNIFAPLFSEEVSKEIFSRPDAVIAGSGYPTGKAIEYEGGYKLTGNWKYCSGSNYATTFTVNCLIERNGQSTTEIISCAVPGAQVKIIEDWQAMGMRATASHTIQLQDVWVPNQYTFSLGNNKNRYKSAISTFPFMPFSEASFLSVCLGLTKSYLKEAMEVAKKKFTSTELEHFQQLKGEIDEQYKQFNKIERQFYAHLGSVWEQHLAGTLAEIDLQQFTNLSQQSAATCIKICHSIFRKMGMEAILLTTRLNQIWRDLQTASQHGFLTSAL